MKKELLERIARTKIGSRFINEQRYRVVFISACSFSFNLLYALYNGILGAIGRSLWFAAMCAYHIILSTMRFSAVLCGRKNGYAAPIKTEYSVMRLSGALLSLLSVVLSVITFISLTRNIAVKYGTVIMISIATYTFGKLTMAVIRAVRQRRNPSPLLAVIRNIGYAEVAASVLTLQRSMLVSFGTMDSNAARTLNAATGGAVCLFVLALGITMLVRGTIQKG